MDKGSDFFIGIDGGGTKCKARLESADGQLLGESIVGPANAARNIEGSIAAIIEASKDTLLQHGDRHLTLDKVHAGIGLAGVNLPYVKEALAQISLPFASVSMTTDLHIACLGAHAGKDGAIVIVGTGSSGIAIVGEQSLEVGGHGFVTGDKGSGAWLGKMAISLCLETLDGIHPQNNLTTRVLSYLRCEQAYDLVKLTINATPAFYAQLAPVVLNEAQKKEPEALQLVQQGADYISQLTNKLLALQPPRLSFIGGVASALQPYLDSTIQNAIQSSILSPEQGAILLAKSNVTKRVNTL